MRIHHWSQYQKCSARDSQCLLGLRSLQAKFRCQQFLQLVERKCPDSPVFGRPWKFLVVKTGFPGDHITKRSARGGRAGVPGTGIPGLTLENGDAQFLSISNTTFVYYLMAHKKGGTSNISRAILASVIVCHWATCFSTTPKSE